MPDVEINIGWTLDSMKKILDEGEYIKGQCYDCGSTDEPVKLYRIAAKASNMMWQDGNGPVWIKQKVVYCDSCAKSFIEMLEEPM